MKRANVIRGRIEEHGEAVGIVDEEMVRQRAREIAITIGRSPNEVTEADLNQARAALEAVQNAPSDEAEQSAAVVRDGPPGSPGRSAPTKLPTDEQTVAEDLVAEGLDEAAHEQMVAGNQSSRNKDRNLEDQLPDDSG